MSLSARRVLSPMRLPVPPYPDTGGRGENRTLTDVSPMVSKTIVSTSSTTRPNACNSQDYPLLRMGLLVGLIYQRHRHYL